MGPDRRTVRAARTRGAALLAALSAALLGALCGPSWGGPRRAAAAPLPSGPVPVVPALVAPAAAQAKPTQGKDPIVRLADRIQKLRAGRITLDAKLLGEMNGLVADVRLIWAVDPSREPEAALVLLDVLGAFLDAPTDASDRQGPGALRDAAEDALRAHVDVAFAKALARDVVAVAAQPVERRVAAIHMLRAQTQQAVLLALLSCTQERAPRLRREALRSLCGWYDPAVHAVFVRELQRELAGDPAAEGALAEEHFAQVSSDAEKRFLPELEPIVKTGLVSSDWRAASRAVTLSRPFANESILPHLIEALSLWKARGPRFGHALRLQVEIERELRQRSGRAFGLDAETWRKWWAAVRRGELPHTTGGNAGVVPVQATKASFFGLKPPSDRIVFVLDRSQSMEGSFQAQGSQDGYRRRWDAAVAQLMDFLEAIGSESRFDVVVFHDYAQSWQQGQLALADADGRRRVKEWLATQVPNGGTGLRAGIEMALQVDPKEGLRLDRLQADTVVVLCDGDTNEGPSWVPRFLEEVNGAARVVFYGVQVGGTGDGTLQALAAGSSGEFVHIEG